jgi:phosphatidylinositol alpha-1,6-mannosyltransferase
VSVFRPGLDTTGLRDRLGIGAHDRLVFSLGRLSRRKGFDQMVRAVAWLRDQGVALHYVIAGIGEDADYLDRLIEEHNVKGVVHRIGAVSEADLPRWMNACDVFAMPNRDIDGDNEGFGMVFIEAAACGKASLAGEAGGTGSAVLHEQTGLRVDGRSVPAIAGSLRMLLEDAALRQRLAEQAYARVLARFAWSRVSQATEQLMHERS